MKRRNGHQNTVVFFFLKWLSFIWYVTMNGTTMNHSLFAIST